MAVIKANAYGHGLIAAARALEEADAFAVARLEEAVALRNAGLNCLRQLKIDNITATLRSFARSPRRLLRILGYPN